MRNERGSTLALCLIIMAMISIFTVSISGILIASRKTKMNELTREKGFYIADSCIELTQADMQTKVATQIATTLGGIGFDEVPVTYNNPETGEVEVYTPEEFKTLFTSYVMQAFCTSDIRNGLKYNRTLSDPDNPLSPMIDADLLGALLTTNVAERFESFLYSFTPASPDPSATAAPEPQFKVETEIEQNMTYSNFSQAYNYTLSDPDYEFPDDFNTGYLRLIYTITYPDGEQEKVRAAFTFDMYKVVKEICDTHSDLIYSKITTEGETDGDDDDVTLTETSYNVDLNSEVVREYLID